MSNQGNEPSKDDLKRQARQLGELLARVGDFYDVAEELAIGYATGVMAPHWPPASPAYTRASQISSMPAPFVEPDLSRDQEDRRRLSERHILLQIGALNELQSVANNVLEWRVDDAREVSISFARIGETMDVSKQAVQQRFGKVRSVISDIPPFSEGD